MNTLELPFDQYQRYQVVQEVVELLRRGKPLQILDVGGHPGFIANFFPEDEPLVLDIMSSQGSGYVQASGLALPFAADSFDLVLSVDTLEHIPPAERATFLGEQWRVSRDYLIIAAPFDSPSVRLAEQIVNQVFIKRFGYCSNFLQEHLSFGLPHLAETLAFLRERTAQQLVLPNGYLLRWLTMMLLTPFVQISLQSPELLPKLNEFYNRQFYRADNRQPCYRTVLLASKKGTLDIGFLQERFALPETRHGESPSETASAQREADEGLAELLATLRLEQPRLLELEEDVVKRTQWAQRLEEELNQKNRRVVQLQEEVEERSRWALGLDGELKEITSELKEITSSWYYRFLGRWWRALFGRKR